MFIINSMNTGDKKIPCSRAVNTGVFLSPVFPLNTGSVYQRVNTGVKYDARVLFTAREHGQCVSAFSFELFRAR